MSVVLNLVQREGAEAGWQFGQGLVVRNADGPLEGDLEALRHLSLGQDTVDCNDVGITTLSALQHAPIL